MKLVGSFFILTILMALSVSAQTPARSSVLATGTASVSVTPDQAQINVSAVTQAATAQDGSGTIKTVNYSVTPVYNYPKDGSAAVLTGYTVTNSIQVILNDLTITG